MDKFLQSYKATSQMGAENLQTAFSMRKLKRQNQLQELSKQYFTEKRPETLSEIASLDPERAKNISDFESGKENKGIKRGAQIASSIKNMPEHMRPFAYQEGLKIAKQEGIDVSDAPQQYNKQADFYLDNVINKARDVEDILKKPEEGKRKVVKDVKGRQRYADTKELVFPGIKGGKNLTGSDAKIYSIVSEGIEDIGRYKDLLKKSGGKVPLGSEIGKIPLAGKTYEKIFAKPSSKQIAVVRRDLTDRIGRLRSGGAIKDTEEDNFMSLIPTLGDDAETIDFKLNKMERNFKAIQKGMGLGGEQSQGDNNNNDPLGIR